MDRLISEQAVIDRLSHWYSDMLETGKEKEDLIDVIKTIPSAEPYKGITNGEVIKRLFTNGRVLNKDECIGFEIIFDDGTSYCSFFDGIWWNSPYEPQESEDKCKNCEYYRNPDYTRCHECKAGR